MLGHPTDHKFLGMVCHNMISGCPVTVQSIKNANAIFGPNFAGVSRRTVRWPPDTVTTDYVHILGAII
jgi:hypothetical protein